MKPLNKKQKSYQSGYAKDRKKIVKPVVAEPVAKPRPPPKPLPEGLPEALQAMGELGRYIKDNNLASHFTVSVDRIDPDWVLVCRGYEPPFVFWGKYEIKYIPSQLMRNPLSRRKT